MSGGAAPPAPRLRSGRDPGGLMLAVTYGVAWVGAIVLLALAGVVLGLVVVALMDDPSVLEGLTEAPGQVPTWAFAVLLGVQLPLMFALAPLSHLVVDLLWYRRHGLDPRPDGWRGVFALHGTWWPFYVLAVAMGLTVGLLPGWLADQLRELLPGLSGTLDQVGHALSSGSPLWRAVFALEVTLGAALVEEAVFRGFMWDALRRTFSLPVTWLGTSLMFALYHMDPVQAPALIPTALALGWLRWASGSLWPCVVVHLVNNGLAVVVGLLAPQGTSEPTPPALAVFGAVVTVGLCAALVEVRRGRGATLRTDAPV